jgi:hypothetical protein
LEFDQSSEAQAFSFCLGITAKLFIEGASYLYWWPLGLHGIAMAGTILYAEMLNADDAVSHPISSLRISSSSLLCSPFSALISPHQLRKSHASFTPYTDLIESDCFKVSPSFV